jgi:succinoglycan biosynthesis transport protein ExoP
MLQLPLTTQSHSRKLVEDLYDFLVSLIWRWRLIAVCVGTTLSMAVIYLANTKPVYRASARLLVLQHGGQPLNVASGASNHDNLFQSVDGYSNSLTTHVMIIRSPLIVGRSLELASLKALSARSVIAGLSVKLPDPTARVLELNYRAGSRDEAVRVVDAVIKSYDRFLQENYQKNSNEVLSLITRARDELSADLQTLEKDYLEQRQSSPANPTGGEGTTLIAKRLDQWNQAINQAALRSLQLKSQLDLGRALAEEGAGIDVITNALSQLSGEQITPAPGGQKPSAGLSYERLAAELGEIEFQRQTAESMLEHLRTEDANAVSTSRTSDDEVVEEFYAEPATAKLAADFKDAQARYDHVNRLVRNSSDPAGADARRRVKDLEKELERMWQSRRPAILARLSQGGEDQTIRQAAGEVKILRAKEAALRERLDQLKSQALIELEAKHDRLAKHHGPQHVKVQEVRQQIARLKGDANEAPADPQQAQSRALLRSIEQGMKSVEATRAEVERRFQQDLAESNRSQIGQLRESNLRNNLERQRALFYSVVDQLKQAQLVSDFGSVTAQILDPPTASESRPSILIVLLAALGVGSGLGAGAVYIAVQLDARIRSLPEIRRLLDYRLLGVVPLLSREQQVGLTLGLACHSKPRSRLAETYKSLRTSIDLLRRNWEGKVFLVTSPQAGDGKSTTASNLAICIAQSGRKVLVLDADLRRPSQHAIHSLARNPGLTHVLKDHMPFHKAVQHTPVENLDLLAAGSEVTNPAELLATDRLGALMRDLRQAYDCVIIDCSPLLVVTDPSIVAVVSDGMLLIVRAEVTRRLDAERTQELLTALESNVLGLVINGINPGQGGYGYGYGYGYLCGYGTYGRSSSSGNGEALAVGPRPEFANGSAELPAIEKLNGKSHHPTIDS